MPDDDRASRVQRELFLRALTAARPSPAVARAIANATREARFDVGDVLYREGESPETVFFIVEGKVELVTDGEEPWTFEDGDVVGVLDANMSRPHARTAVARSPVSALVIDAEDWLEVLADNLSFSAEARQNINRTLFDMVLSLSPDGAFPAPPEPDPDEVPAVIEGKIIERVVALRQCLHFERASVQALVELARRADLIRAPRGATVIAPGAARKKLFVVMSGTVEIEHRSDPPLKATFGPSALVLGSSAFAGALNEFAVTALTDSVLVSLHWTDIDDVAEDHFDLSRALFRGAALDREQCMAERARRARASRFE